MQTERIKGSERITEELKKEFFGHMIPYWMDKVDHKYGGYYGQMDYQLNLNKEADKGCILNSRILWFFSNLYETFGEVKYLECAKMAYDFLRNNFLDREYGGVYWMVTYDGKPSDDSKHSYNHSFAIYALSSYYIASGDRSALDLAYQLFDIVETRMRDEDGYLEAFNRDFTLASNEKLSENGVMATRTMNTILHLMEAYTELYRADKADYVKAAIHEILSIFRNKIFNPEKERLEVFFDADYNSLIDLHSYGHDIEAAWLIDRTVQVLGDEGTEYDLSDITGILTKKIYEAAFDGTSLPAECEEGKVLGLRIWWVECEAIVGFMNGYQKDSSRTEYREAAERIWEFTRDNLVDKREGSEWYYEVNPENIPTDTQPILDAWKCPYHNGRMFMEILKREGKLRTFKESYEKQLDAYRELIKRKNYKTDFYNGIYDRWKYPVLTRNHIPPFWKYDLNEETNPYCMERLGVNAVMNSGAIYMNGRFYLVARIEGNDRKSFFGVAVSDNGVDGFEFMDYPILLPDMYPEETNVYDMRLTKHEDGWIYGVFCSESKDTTTDDLSAAVAQAGIVRTKDLINWERLPNLKTLRSPQQRNCVLYPEFVNGKYAFYTRPMDDFIETGSGGGIGFGLCDDIEHAIIDEEIITSERKYHTITEAKNGAGAVPIKTPKGYIHIAHGVRNTAAGLRYVIYAFATDLNDPTKVIAEPSGFLIAPLGDERIGDVSNVVFTNGAVVDENENVYIYYASSDTRLHVATTTMDKLVDYVFNTPEDPGRSVLCVRQRIDLIKKNLEIMNKNS